MTFNNINNFTEGSKKFLIGLAKKVLLANNIGLLWTTISSLNTSNLSVLTAWIGIIAFTFKIYFNFSGYYDMAIGISKMFGLNLLESFDYPYMSKSITEFFKRWNLSLGDYFRKYIYISFEGNKHYLKNQFIDFFIVWILIAFFSGGIWNFLLWGIYFSVILLIEKFYLKEKLDNLPNFVAHIYTMLIVMIGWVLFSLDNLSMVGQYLKVMFFMSGNSIIDTASIYYLYTNIISFIILTLCATPYLSEKFNKLQSNTSTILLNVLILFLSVSYLVSDNYNHKENFFTYVKTSTDLLIGKKDINNVYLGADGYLLKNFAPSDDKTINNTIKSLNDFSNKHKDTKTYICVMPTSASILKNKLPKFAPSKDQEKYLKNLSSSLNKNIKYIDTYKALNDAKNKYIYYKTDNHLTTLGAYTSFFKISEKMQLDSNAYYDIKKVSNDFNGSLSLESGLRFNQRDDIDIYIPEGNKSSVVVDYLDNKKKTTSLYNTQNLNAENKYDVFLDGNHPIVEINTTTNTQRQLLLVKDSYANVFVPFLTDNYSKIVVIDPMYYKGDLSKLIDNGKFSDILFLYNANTFFSDNSLSKLLNK
ncbi:DHHW family protein [Romboutsia sedimentorum]|uniref:DHHW family protein n=1 Tax=Romboutsia sedimentorum TaxID=1368474 RepID=UPI0024DEAF2F|nr:DHHW family protein [Romboutsia sedimentorum]MDK2585311.1 DHHW family protein [Romboutsia sedimentorum]